MKKIFFLILILIFLGKVNLFNNAKASIVCCEIDCIKKGQKKYEWRDFNSCVGIREGCILTVKDDAKCSSVTSTKPSSGEAETKPGKVTIEWEEKQLRICPPSIFGTPPCQYPDIQTIVKKFIDFILSIAPPTLVILLIIGGFLYMLSVFKPDLISLGHKYIQWAFLGYLILLLITLVFTFIRAIFGGPKL